MKSSNKLFLNSKKLSSYLNTTTLKKIKMMQLSYKNLSIQKKIFFNEIMTEKLQGMLS